MHEKCIKNMLVNGLIFHVPLAFYWAALPLIKSSTECSYSQTTRRQREKKNLYEVQHAAQIREPIWIPKRAFSVLKRVISIQYSSTGSSAHHTTETPVKSGMIRIVKLIRKPGGKDKLYPSSQIPGEPKRWVHEVSQYLCTAERWLHSLLLGWTHPVFL